MVYIDKKTLETMFGVKSSSFSMKNSPIELKTSQKPDYSLAGVSSLDEFSDQNPSSAEDSKQTKVLDTRSAFKKIERLVKVRDRSVHEVKVRLEKDNYPESSITEAIERALVCGYLDDARFADVLIRSRLRAGKGLAGIVVELKRNGINPETELDNFPDAYLSMFPDQKDSAIALLCKKPPRAKNKLQAAYAKLIRAGYTSALASEAAREWYRMRE